jgi:hypothetical protein
MVIQCGRHRYPISIGQNFFSSEFRLATNTIVRASILLIPFSRRKDLVYTWLILLELSKPTNVIILISIASVVLLNLFRIVRFLHWKIKFKQFSHINACLPPRAMPYSSKLSRSLGLLKAKADVLDSYLVQKYLNNGWTHVAVAVIDKRVKAIYTAEPDNFKAILSTRSNDWQRSTVWASALQPFLSPGILTTVG